MMTEHAEAFYEALWTDLRRNRTDADLTDVKYLADEAEHVLAHLREWMKPVPVSTPTLLEPSDVRVRKGQLLLAVSPQASQAWGDNPGCPARAVRPAPPAAHAPPRGPAS